MASQMGRFAGNWTIYEQMSDFKKSILSKNKYMRCHVSYLDQVTNAGIWIVNQDTGEVCSAWSKLPGLA